MWSAARSAKISMILCMPERVSGGDAKFQGFCDRWNKWEGQPRSPELNPVENVWQFMRDNWLSNRIFKSYEDIVALCCQAWNNLIDQPWKIMSLGMRKWAHGF